MAEPQLLHVRRLMAERRGDRVIAETLDITRHQARNLMREVELADARRALPTASEGRTGGSLAKYDAACRAIAEALQVDEIMTIRDEMEMRAAAGRIAGNRQLERQAVELRMRATRRLGEIIAKQKETVGLNAGRAGAGRPALGGTQSEQPKDDRPKLSDVGISRKLSSQAQKMASIPAAEFEGLIGAWRAESAAVDGKLTTNLLKVGAEQRQREARIDLAKALSDKALAMTGARRYPAIYFDPPWRRKQGITDRSYENHYPTMTWHQIIEWARSMRGYLLDNAWGMMWIPRAHMLALVEIEIEVTVVATGEVVKALVKMPLAWAVAEAMGFDAYSTAWVWTKTDDDHPDDIGSGILVRDQDEILLLFKKGRGLPKPKRGEVYTSNHRERSKPLGHSRKPQHYREMIASMTAGLPVLECFARHDAEFPLPAGWDSWGNQAQPNDASRASS